MMIGFFKDYFKYKDAAKKQQRRMEKYCKQNGYKGETLTVIVEREQEVRNLEKIAAYRGYECSWEPKDDHF